MRSRRFGLGTLLTTGFAIAIALTVIMGLFSMVSLGTLATSLSEMATGSKEVSLELSKLKEASSVAASEAESLKEAMNSSLVKKLRTNSADMADLQKTFGTLSASLSTLIESEEEDSTLLLLEIEDIHEMVQREWTPLIRTILAGIDEATQEGTRMASTVSEQKDHLLEFAALASASSEATDGIQRVAGESSKSANGTRAVMLIVLVAAVLGVFIAGYFTKRGIIGPIKNVTDRIRDIAEGEGDLTKRLDASLDDELGRLSGWFNTFVGKLEDIISSLANNSSALAEHSQELSEAASLIANGTEEQSRMAEHVATATEEMNATIVEVAQNASNASTSTQEANGAASTGCEVVTRTIESMNGIALTARDSSAVISTLGSRSQEIGKIIRVINDIAEQTNLLALNAAIEAARAGDQGRGFAVVADEVRKLSERTSSSTKEISSMVKAIQEETDKATVTMEKQISVVEEGVALAEEAGSALRDITGQVELVNSVIGQIATASEEQSVAADQISGDINNVATVTGKTSDTAHRIDSLGKEIDQLAHSLNDTVSKFKVSSRPAAFTETAGETTPVLATDVVEEDDDPLMRANG